MAKKSQVMSRDAIRQLAAAKTRLEQAQAAIAAATAEVSAFNVATEGTWAPIPASVSALDLATPIAAIASELADADNKARL